MFDNIVKVWNTDLGGNMIKNTAHNLNEVKALVKESYSSGNEMTFDKTKWFSHDGKFIATSFVFDTEFELVVEDTDSLDGYRSLKVEVL